MLSSRKHFASLAVVLICELISYVHGKDFVFKPASKDIFSECTDLGIKKSMKDMAYLSELKLEVLTSEIRIEGDTKYIWDINPDYRIEVLPNLLKMFIVSL